MATSAQGKNAQGNQDSSCPYSCLSHSHGPLQDAALTAEELPETLSAFVAPCKCNGELRAVQTRFVLDKV